MNSLETIGSNKIKITCLSCGHEFRPGQDLKNLEIQRRQQAEAMKKPGFWIFFAIITIFFVLIIRACFGNHPTNSSNNETGLNTKTTINISGINFEILSSSNAPEKIDVYVQKSSDIKRLNEYLIAKYNSNSENSMIINYFDNKEIGANYFTMINDPKYTEAQLGDFFKHYIAQYDCNPTTNYKELKFMHQ